MAPVDRVRRLLRQLVKEKPCTAVTVTFLRELAGINWVCFVKEGGYPLVISKWTLDARARMVLRRLCSCWEACLATLSRGLWEDLLRFCRQKDHQEMAIDCLGNILLVTYESRKHLQWKWEFNEVVTGLFRTKGYSTEAYAKVLSLLPQILQALDEDQHFLIRSLVYWLQNFFFDWPRSRQPRQPMLDALHVIRRLVQAPLHWSEVVHVELSAAIYHCARYAKDKSVREACELTRFLVLLQDVCPSLEEVVFKRHKKYNGIPSEILRDSRYGFHGADELQLLDLNRFVDTTESVVTVMQGLYQSCVERWTTQSDARLVIRWICCSPKLCSHALALGVLGDVVRFIDDDCERASAVKCLCGILENCTLSNMIVESCQEILTFCYTEAGNQQENPERNDDTTARVRVASHCNDELHGQPHSHTPTLVN